MSRSRERGVSLLEIMIATAILAILMAAAFYFTRAVADGINFETQAITLEQDAMRVLEVLAHSLRSARLTPGMSEGANADLIAKGYPPLDGSEDLGNTVDVGGGVTRETQAGQICFQVPVDHDEDGDITDANLATEWGAKREDLYPTDYRDAYIAYRFRAVGTFDEAARRYDLNRDGDMNDVFDVGHLETIYTAGGTHLGQPPPTGNSVIVNMISGNAIVRAQGQEVGRIDGDGYDDPMFTLNRVSETTTVLTITLFTARPGEKNPLLVKVQTAVEMRNK